MTRISKLNILNLIGLIAMIFTGLAAASVFDGSPDTGHIVMAAGFTFGSLDWTGGDNMGGFTSKAYLAIADEVNTWPALSANPATDADLVTLSGTYEFAEGKSFYEIYATKRTFGGDAESQGELDGKSFLQKGEFFFPGTQVEGLAFVRKINNQKGIIIGIDPNTGNRIQFGSETLPLSFSAKVAYGKAATDRRGITIEFETDHTHAGLLYNGAIPLSGSTVPPLS